MPVSSEVAPFLSSFFDSCCDEQVSSKPVDASMAVPYFENTSGFVTGVSNLARLLEL